MGRKIKILVNSQKNTGSNTVQWNGTNDKGVSVKTGVYFYKIESMGYSKIRKMILIK
jgi:flagellar hook assembly protein FlgD